VLDKSILKVLRGNMRLKDTLDLLNNNIPPIQKIEYKTINSQITRISNLEKAFESFKELSNISSFTGKIESIFKFEPFNNLKLDAINIDTGTANSIQNSISSIVTNATLLKEILEDQIIKSDLDSFSILLPQLKGFSDYSNFFNTMDKIVLLPLFGESEIEITGFDVGSKWINIYVSTAVGIFIFTQVVRQSFDLYIKDYHQAKTMEVMIKSYNASHAAQEEFLKIIKTNYEASLLERTNTALSEIEKKYPDTINKKSDTEINDYKNNLKFSIEEMSKLIDKGLEIYKAIEDDKDNDPIFDIPNFKDKNKLLKNSEQKLLGHSPEKKE